MGILATQRLCRWTGMPSLSKQKQTNSHSIRTQPGKSNIDWLETWLELTSADVTLKERNITINKEQVEQVEKMME